MAELETDVSKYDEPVETFPLRIPLGGGKVLTIDLINVLTLGTVLIPTVCTIIFTVVFWGQWAGPLEIGMFLGGTLITGLGITLGYHRFFTHGSYETSPIFTRILGICGAMSVQGPILFWCCCHRTHHQHSDREGDLHSPHLSGDGLWGWIKGIVHAHFGWIIIQGSYKYKPRLVKDLHANEDVRFVDHYYFLWIFLSLALPTLVGGLYHLSWAGAFLGLIWGGLARIFFVHHLTWSVNSFGHIFGTQTFRTHDESRNNFFLALVGMGDGWHNNHHAFPRSARHGMTKWEFDLTYEIIKFLEKTGLVWNVRRCTEEQLRSKMLGKSPSKDQGLRT